MKRNQFVIVLLCSLLLISCAARGNGSKKSSLVNAGTITTLELPYWHWTFRISDDWRIQQQSPLFAVKKDVGEEAFRHLVAKNRNALFTLTPTNQQQGPNVLTLVVSLLPLHDRSENAKDWLSSQVHALSGAYEGFKVDKSAHRMIQDKRWVEVDFSFANPGSASAQPVHSVFMGRIVNGSGLIIALADPTGKQSFSDGFLKSVVGMVNISSGKSH